MQIPKLYVVVEKGIVIGIWYDNADGIDCMLNDGIDYVVEYGQKRTERCKVCSRTYLPSELVERETERLCLSCDMDKHPEDYPGIV